ncbi:hypothetical protein QVD17_09171 [Tagetes erecta]|uniref:ZF-HD dimerization-type domain-containing protein n=1 Tax=Tagetes erecta TaxID=13708 RepID=A0AAD8L457_TARER|nr:hypothetical protein QVD17_09171 [Tagetes erecta]
MDLTHEHMEAEAVVENAERTNIANIVFRYRECTKNKATAVDLKALDGCLEFMPGGEPGTLEALSCAACTCHRNFHRKEPQGHVVRVEHFHYNYPAGYVRMMGPAPIQTHPSVHQPSASRGNLATGSDPMSSGASGSSSKRRHTNISKDQKARMLAFVQEVGWRLNKEHEERVQLLCAEIGITKKVFKTWMHNYRYKSGKKA